MEFIFPDLFEHTKQKKEKEEKALDETKNNFKAFLEKNKQRPGTPGWFAF